MALILSRRKGEALRIGDIVVTVRELKGNRVSIAITAPPETKVLRGELVEKEGER